MKRDKKMQIKKKYNCKCKEKFNQKILFIFWLILLTYLIRYFFIFRGTPDIFAFMNNESERLQWSFIYFITRFSKQSNFLVFIIITLKLTRFKNKKWFPYLVFIGLIDILLTGLIYNIVIDNFNTFKTIYKNYKYLSINVFEHIYIPFLYLMFFLFSNSKTIALNKFFISSVHPFFYFIIFVIIGLYDRNFNSYPYSFINPNIGKCLLKFLYNKEPKGWTGVFINFLLITLIINILSYVLILIKNSSFKNKKN